MKGETVRTKITTLFAACISFGAAQIASAADMPVKAPMAPAAAAYNWTGFYVGINGGYATGHTTGGELPAFFTGGNFNINGGLVGGTVGYNYQFNHNWVVGLEADWDWANVNGGSTVLGAATMTVKDLGTLRGRVGYAWDRWLVYATGGWAWSDRVTVFCPGCTAAFNTESHSLNGYAVGGGVEYGITQNISMKAEYIYAHLNTATYFVPAGCPGPCDIGANVHTFRLGANWRFWGMGM
jgi:outer membrane immunogenic protein